jgi:hypothetical protein
MCKYFISAYLFFLYFNGVSGQNLILNPSFEQLGQPWCEAWYDVCGSPFATHCDTNFQCGARIIPDSPPAPAAGSWGVELFGSFPTSTSVTTYSSGREGTYVYQLKFWMDTPTFIGEVYWGLVRNGAIVNPNFFTDSGHPWTEYTLRDTIFTHEQDSIGVQVGAGIGDFCICRVSFDLIELTVIDSIVTAIKPIQQNNNYLIYPNPFSDDITILSPDGSGLDISIYDMNGVTITSFEGINPSPDLSFLNPGIYFYRIRPQSSQLPSQWGKLVKE